MPDHFYNNFTLLFLSYTLRECIRLPLTNYPHSSASLLFAISFMMVNLTCILSIVLLKEHPYLFDFHFLPFQFQGLAQEDRFSGNGLLF